MNFYYPYVKTCYSAQVARRISIFHFCLPSGVGGEEIILYIRLHLYK